jgi:hypothetical protein
VAQEGRTQRAVIDLIRASAIEAHGFLGYLDHGDGDGEPFWLPPQSQSLWEYLDREEEGAPFHAPARRSRTRSSSSSPIRARFPPGHSYSSS